MQDTIMDEEPMLKYTVIFLHNEVIQDEMNSFYRANLETKTFARDTVLMNGMDIGYTYDLMLTYINEDLVYAILAISVIGLMVYLYCSSILMVLAAIINMILSYGSGYFVYHLICRFEFFGFLNICTLFLLIAIGADDLFMVHDAWKNSKRIAFTNKLKNRSKSVQGLCEVNPGFQIEEEYEIQASSWDSTHQSSTDKTSVGKEPEQEFNFTSDVDYSQVTFTEEDYVIIMADCFHHAIKSILITSLTTSVAMLACYSSQVTAIRNFGVYSFICIMINFLLMITWVPSLIIIEERRSRKNCLCSCQCKGCSNVISRIRQASSKKINQFFSVILPNIIVKGWFIFIPLFVIVGK